MNYKFEKEDKNEIKIISKTPLNNTNFMFYNCSSLTSLNLSNFNTNNITDIMGMFSGINKRCNLICNDESILNEFS